MTLGHISTEWKAAIVCALIAFLYLLFDQYLRARAQARAQAWPVAYGKVSKTAIHEGKHKVTLTLWYSYQLPDEAQPVLAEFQKEFFSLEEAERWADNLFDKTVFVRINPANPWKSQLLDSELEVIVTSNAPEAQT